MRTTQSLALSLLSLQYELALLVGKDLQLLSMLRQFLMPVIKILSCQSAHVWLCQNQQTAQWVYSYPTANSHHSLDTPELNTLTKTWCNSSPSRESIQLELKDHRFVHLLPIGDIGFVLLIRVAAPIEPHIVQALAPIFARLHLACKASLEHEQSVNQRLISEQNEQRIEAVLQSIDDIVFQLDSQGRITYFNPAWTKITGYSSQASIGQTLASCLDLSGLSLENFNKFIFKPSSSALNFQVHLNNIPDHSIYLAVQIRHTPHLLASNTLFIGSINNITEQSVLINNLNEARQKSEAAAQAKSTFLSTMSHEMRTPLNGILGLTEACITATTEADTKQQLGYIQESGQYLLSLINDVLDYSRIEAGFLELHIEQIDLHVLLQSLTNQYIQLALQKGLELNLFIEPTTPQCVMGDAQRLRQVLINLIGNAIKFTEQGRINIRAQAENATTLLFEVSDTGIGVPKHLHEHIFNAFAQADESTARHFGGSGLGLAITQRIVHAMDGHVGIRPAQPKGSCFWFTAKLPTINNTKTTLLVKQALSNEQHALGHSQILPKYKILVVDDHPINRKLMGVFLQQLGQDVKFAENGEMAVEAHISNQFDLIFMDIQMPKMDGLLATQSIRTFERGHHQAATPIYAVSANCSPQDIKKSEKAGMNGHLSKPITRQVIHQTLQTLMS